MPRHTPTHPGPVDSLRPTNIGAYYVQPTLTYYAGQGFTTEPVRGSWDVRTIEGNKLLLQADTRLGAISEAHALNAEGTR